MNAPGPTQPSRDHLAAKTLNISALLLALLAVPVDSIADVCKSADQKISESNRSVKVVEFCQGGFPGTDCPDAATLDTAVVNLQLEGKDKVDVTCTVKEIGPSLCLVGADCSAIDGSNTNSITLKGSVDWTEFTLLVIDNGADQFCNNVDGVTIDCNGNWGTDEAEDPPDPPDPPSKTLYEDSFETRCYDRWDARKNLPACGAASANLTSNQARVHPQGAYESTSPGLHRATVEARPGTELELLLWRWKDPTWSIVASAAADSFPATLQFEGDAGFYFWEVNSISQTSRYWIRYEHPSLPSAQAASGNRMYVTDAQAKDGRFSLESVYTASKKKTFLIDELSSEESYRARFWIRPLSDFSMNKKDQHTVLLGRQGKSRGPVLFKIVIEGHNKSNKYRARLMQRIDGEYTDVGKAVQLKRDKWTRLIMEWSSAANGGFVCLAKGTRCKAARRAPSSDSRVLDRIEFGQVERNDSSTTGRLVFDLFESERIN